MFPFSKIVPRLLVSAALLAARPAVAQRIRQPAEETLAATGSPFGVGRMTVRLPQGAAVSPLAAEDYTLAEKNGRARYPAFGDRPMRALLRGFIDRPEMVTGSAL